MASGAEVIRQIKERIAEVDPREVHDLIEAGPNGTVVVDVREQHEFEESHLPGAKHVPRGYLESRIEGVVPGVDRSAYYGFSNVDTQQIDVDSLISEEYPLAKGVYAMKRARTKGVLKVLLRP